MAPVMSPADIGDPVSAAAAGGIATDAVLSGMFGTELLSDCRPLGVGALIDGAAGAGAAGLALLSAGA
jgi:hypothetical protein